MMPPKVDLDVRKAMEAAATARAAEKKKKRPVVHAGQYELKRMRRGPQVDPAGGDTALLKVETSPTVSLMAIPIGVSLTQMARGSTSRSAHPEVKVGSLLRTEPC